MELKTTARLAPQNKNHVLANCITVVDGAFELRTRVVQGRDGIFIGMPQERGRDGGFYNTARAVSKEAKEAFRASIMAAYESAKAAAVQPSTDQPTA